MFMKTLPKDNFDINQYNLHNYYDILMYMYISINKKLRSEMPIFMTLLSGKHSSYTLHFAIVIVHLHCKTINSCLVFLFRVVVLFEDTVHDMLYLNWLWLMERCTHV